MKKLSILMATALLTLGACQQTKRRNETGRANRTLYI